VNFYPSKAVRLASVALIAISGALPSLAHAATAAPKASKAPKAHGKATMNTLALPSVSAQAGVAPVIGKPVGAAPTKLITKDIIVGKGQAALTSSTVTAQYVVMSWKTGVVYQTSWTAQPFTAPLANLIAGWQQGIPGMKIGGRRLFIIPPALAYGAQGAGNIPANETLVFVVDLLGVK
jgi:peptidylprolyl isomerase